MTVRDELVGVATRVDAKADPGTWGAIPYDCVGRLTAADRSTEEALGCKTSPRRPDPRS